jgi:DUF1680 family protein
MTAGFDLTKVSSLPRRTKFIKPLSQEPLYQPFGNDSVKRGRPVSMTLIPYYAWANRESSAMQVWMAARNR